MLARVLEISTSPATVDAVQTIYASYGRPAGNVQQGLVGLCSAFVQPGLGGQIKPILGEGAALPQSLWMQIVQSAMVGKYPNLRPSLISPTRERLLERAQEGTVRVLFRLRDALHAVVVSRQSSWQVVTPDAGGVFGLAWANFMSNSRSTLVNCITAWTMREA